MSGRRSVRVRVDDTDWTVLERLAAAYTLTVPQVAATIIRRTIIAQHERMAAEHDRLVDAGPVVGP